MLLLLASQVPQLEAALGSAAEDLGCSCPPSTAAAAPRAEEDAEAAAACLGLFAGARCSGN